VSGCSGPEWLEIADRVPSERLITRARALARRRAGGEPLQYVLGSWSFRGIELMVDPRVLIPRPETEWVVEVALEEAQRLGLRRASAGRRLEPRSPSAFVADLGTGSGAIALALERELPDVEVWATDVSADALRVASANAAGNAAERVRLARGDWFAALPRELRGALTLVVSNPPYVAAAEMDALPPEVARYEPHAALTPGPEGTEAIDRIVRDAPDWLDARGSLVCEIAPAQEEVVTARALDAGFAFAFVRPDLAGWPRVLVARRRADG
jgi:release factor glutamine methyltransferase